MSTRINQLSQQTLTLGGTPQRITSDQIIGYSVLILAASTNAGSVFIGNASVTSTNSALKLAAGNTFLLENIDSSGGHEKIDLRDIYWDGTTGDKISVSYTERT